MKKSPSYPWFIVLGTVSIFFLGAVIGFILTRPCGGPSCLSFPDQTRFRTLETYEHTAKTWRGMLRDGERMLRIETVEHVNADEASEFTTIRLASINGLYDTVLSPYPGAVSQTVRCDEQYKPRTRTLTTNAGVPLSTLSGFLNTRLQFGSCVDDQIAYTNHLALFYCRDAHRWVSMELIEPVKSTATDKEIQTFFESVSCR